MSSRSFTSVRRSTGTSPGCRSAGGGRQFSRLERRSISCSSSREQTKRQEMKGTGDRGGCLGSACEGGVRVTCHTHVCFFRNPIPPPVSLSLALLQSPSFLCQTVLLLRRSDWQSGCRWHSLSPPLTHQLSRAIVSSGSCSGSPCAQDLPTQPASRGVQCLLFLLQDVSPATQTHSVHVLLRHAV